MKPDEKVVADAVEANAISSPPLLAKGGLSLSFQGKPE